MLSDEEHVECVRSKMVVGRTGEPAGDSANAVFSLAGSNSSFLTGQTLVVCGSRQIRVTATVHVHVP